MDDIDAMFSDLLGEMDLLTQSLEGEIGPPEEPPSSNTEINFSIGFTDLNESLNQLEDQDLDELMAQLASEVSEAPWQPPPSLDGPPLPQVPIACAPSTPPVTATTACNTAPARTAMPQPASLPPPSQPSKALPPEEAEAQGKADKIKLALEKLKEAKVKKLVIKVLMNDGSSKTLMVDETQTVRDVLDNLFEKTHCDCSVDWTLFETNPELQIERGFEDHEFLVDTLSAWTRDSENKILFLERRDKYAVFKNPQFYYLWKKQKAVLEDMKEQDKGLLITENFCKGSIIVPDLEGPLYLKDDGKKSWKRRYFLLRASGIYYVPKGKTKTSTDLACFVQFDNVNVYYGMEYKNKYKAPTEHCFILKHPQIQKESQYIRYLCCDDKRILDLWVTSIRIAKYGETLYENYKTAVRKASGTSGWTSRIASNPSAASPVPKAKAANGHAPQASLQPKATPTTAISEAKDLGVDQPKASYPPLPPATESCPPPQLPNPALPPPPPPSPTPRTVPPPPKPLPSTAHCQTPVLPPPPPDPEDLPHPPPDFFSEPPPDFVPPPPPGRGNSSSEGVEPSLPPPPHPGQSVSPVPARRKIPPAPPKRTTPVAAAPSGGDMMSELANAMQKRKK